MRSRTDCCAPSPSAIIAITAATPITMPSIVSSERRMFARNAAKRDAKDFKAHAAYSL